MKKALSILLMLALLSGALAIPALADSTLLSWNGFEAKVTGYTKQDSSDGYTYIHLDVHVKNGSGHSIWLHVEDIMVDGTEVYAAGITGISKGADKDDWILIKPNDANRDGGSGAISSGETIDMTLVLDDDTTYEELYRQDVHIDLSSLSVSGGGYDEGIDDVDFGHGGYSGNTAPSYTPASYDFTTLKKGSKGQAVKDLQQRLTDLGYLNDKVDGSFGTVTGIAVMSFCDQNGLSVSAEATPEMQSLLYSSSAKYYSEPYIPLVIGTEYKWKSNTRNDVGTFYIQLVNRSHRQIRGYEIYLYRTNMWDEKIYNDDGGWLYKYEEIQTFKPGQWQNTNPLVFGYFAYTYTVWAGIHKIVFDDGEIREVDYDDIEWFPCVVKKK